MKKTNKKPEVKKTNNKKPMPYGIKAYGKWTRFATAEEYQAYLEKWIDETDGHEQDRAIKALSDLLVGVKTTDTDKMPEAVPVPKPAPKPEAKVLTDEEKRAKRNEYARNYYKLHREKLAEASRLCHAKRRAADKAAKLEYERAAERAARIEAAKEADKKAVKKTSKKGAK